ncbi:MAG: MBL fold metallo-hydrolase, partial [Dehalococcoidia bacterium]|nr:MBL fold metallo-hydrolase [Dehalococcoidia bacterium]
MRITFCGTGQAYLDSARAGASIFVEDGGSGILLDCGPGSLARLPAAGIKFDQIRAVLVSHLHFDHTLGIPELLVRMAFEEVEMPAIYGPSGTERYMDGATNFARLQLGFLAAGLWQERVDGIAVHEPAPGARRTVAGIEIEGCTVPHAGDLHSLAWRVATPQCSVVYSGDTSPSHEAFSELARGTDILIHESYTRAGLLRQMKTMPAERHEAVDRAFIETHSDIEQVATIARDTGVSTLILTHLLPLESPEDLRTAA